MARTKTTQTTEVARLPMPDRLEPKSTARFLMTSVRIYFYKLYNDASGKFKELLASVGNKDAIHGNRMFDRQHAVTMIKLEADKAGDKSTTNAVEGDIYKCIVNLMRKEEIGLKLRRRQYDRLTHQQAAE